MFIHFLGILSYLGVTSWYKSKTKILMLEYNLLKKNFKAYGILQARILEWVVVPFSRGIFPTQGLNPGLQHCRQILYQLSHQGSPRILEWVAYPFSRWSSGPRNWTGFSCIAGGFFTSWATREAQMPIDKWSNVSNIKKFFPKMSDYENHLDAC